jgi:hypothetical protein
MSTPVMGLRRGCDNTTTQHYRTIDLRSGRGTPLGSVPIASDQSGRYRAVWAPGASQIALTKVQLARQVSESTPSEIALLRIETTEARCITSPDQNGPAIFGLHLPHGDEIRARYKVIGQSTYSERVLRRRGSVWHTNKRSSVKSRSVIELRVHESLNEPPCCWQPILGRARAARYLIPIPSSPTLP